ncbi:hypothetical protein [Massilia sp. TWR1-2-2]|uniref:hypothetical protein n=1 Tax=Massilia sp. TWR1-2-2 TaxID=2804584 RepID=UPI003CE8CDA4
MFEEVQQQPMTRNSPCENAGFLFVEGFWRPFTSGNLASILSSMDSNLKTAWMQDAKTR